MNSNKSEPTGGAAGTAALEARIERIRQTIAAQQARIARSSMLTAAVGAILCVLMAVYFYIGYSEIKKVATPKRIVEAAESIVMEQLPDARKALEVQINDSADEWAASISQQVQDNIPGVRSKLEELVVTKADEAMEGFQVLTNDQFRKFLTDNKDMMTDGFKSLRKPDEAERFVHDLHSAVEKQLSGDMRQQSEDMLHTAIDLRAKLQVLKDGKKLDEEQALEREILMIAKRLQTESQADLVERPKKRSKPRFIEGGDAEQATAAKTADDAVKPAEAKADGDESKAPGEGSKQDKP